MPVGALVTVPEPMPALVTVKRGEAPIFTVTLLEQGVLEEFLQVKV